VANLVPVLLAGGSGTRLWPTSRKSYPKQFADLLVSGDSLLQAAIRRSVVLPNASPWIIVTGEDYRFLVAQQANETGIAVDSIVLEPEGRNTAPAIALAAFEAIEFYDSPKLLVQTADHCISDLKAFEAATTQAYRLAAPFILFGVKPTRPETGYGYIECGTSSTDEFLAASFTEKPGSEMAKKYLESGNYLWNSGMFLLDAAEYLDALKTFEPSIYKACRKAHQNAVGDLDFKRVDRDEFIKSPSASIDCAVIERLAQVHVIPYRGDWSDVGSWDSLASLTNQDNHGNAVQGDGILLDSVNTFVRAESRLVAGIGLEDIIVIETRDAVLISDRANTQNVRKLVDLLKSKGRNEATTHQKNYRPWGFYETLIVGDRFQVKQIVVNPKAKLSLQIHQYRAEHWVIVSGVAEVQVDESIFTLHENQSTYIPVNRKHRLTNPAQIPLTLIEVQSGNYLGEDDIFRLDDIYGRN